MGVYVAPLPLRDGLRHKEAALAFFGRAGQHAKVVP
jgi:hypothetical protein